jgi:hypothetical protein
VFIVRNINITITGIKLVVMVQKEIEAVFFGKSFISDMTGMCEYKRYKHTD